jgi:2'-5' RNA ligase
MANWFIGLPVRAEQLPPDAFDSLPAGMRRFATGDLHITVAFFGGVDAAAAHAAWATAWPQQGPLAPHVAGPAAFGHPRRPSAYGLELGDGRDKVATLIADWRDRLREAAGLAPETRAPRPHITLARVPRRAGPALRRRAADWVDSYEPEPSQLDLDAIALYTWSDDRRSRQFQIVERARLPCTAG